MAEVKIAADSGGGSVALKGPASTTGNAAVSLKLPVADGSASQLLKTDGSGNLGWMTGGKLLQCKVNYDATIVTVSNTTGNQSAEYGLNSYRVYGDLNTITITPVSATSTMIIQGLSGTTNSNSAVPSQGAYGIVAILNNAATGAIDNTNYQYYPLATLYGSGATTPYLPNTVVTGHYAAGNTTEQVWRLKGYAYTEGSNSIDIRYQKHHLIVWEVEI